MADPEDRIQNLLLGIAAAAALAFGVALVVVAVNLGSRLVTSWLLFVFQGLAFLVAAALAWVLVSSAIERVLERAERFAHTHPRAARVAKVQRPAIGAVFVLAASVLPSIGSPFFGSDALLATCVGVVMSILFFCASYYMSDTQKWARWVGYGVWYITALLLPAAIGIYNHWNIHMIAETAGLNTPVDVALLIAIGLCLLVLPRWAPGPAA